MLAIELTKIISNARLTEDAVLTRVKALFSMPVKNSRGKLGKKALTGRELSPLAAAATRGFTRVAKYLIEDKKFDPNIIDIGHQSPLDLAIYEEHVETAKYLASHKTEYAPDVLYGYTSLHLAACRNQIEVVKNILAHKTAPVDLRSRQGATALLLAAEQGQLESIKLLVKAGANFNIPDKTKQTAWALCLGFIRTNVISYFLNDLNVSALENVKVGGVACLPLRLIIDSDRPMKLPAILTLLEAGAGLDLQFVPPEVYEYLKSVGQVKNDNWDCIIMGTHTSGSTPSKRVFITSKDQFIACLNNPEYTFKLNAIGKSLQSPLLRELPHIQEIADIINPAIAEQLPSLSSSLSASSSSAAASSSTETYDSDVRAPIANFEKLDSATAVMFFSSQEKVFSEESHKVMVQIENYLAASLDQEETRESQISFNSILSNYLKNLDETLCYSNCKKIKDRDLFKNVMNAFNSVYVKIFLLSFVPEYNKFNLVLLSSFAENLRNIIHIHAKTLRGQHSAIHNSLLDAHALALGELAWNYLKEEKLELAQTLTVEALYNNSKLIVNNDWLKKSQNIVQANGFSILAQIDIKEARFRSAIKNVERALDLILSSPAVGCRGLSQAVLMLSERSSHFEISKMIELTTKTQSYLSRLAQCKNDPSMLISPFVMDELKFEDAISQKLAVLNVEMAKKVAAEQAAVKAAAKAARKAKRVYAQRQQTENVTAQLTDTIERLESLSIAESSASSSSSSDGLSSSSQAVIFTPRVKIKTTGVSNPALDKKRRKPAADPSCENPMAIGFAVPAGYIQPVPIVSDYLSDNHLFVTMPENHPDFLAFYKLIEGNEIRGIAQSSLGRQGVKLGKAEVQLAPGKPHQLIPIARLKTCGGQTVRPWGYIEQTHCDPEAGVRKLFVFRPENLHDKKDEYNRGYRP